MRDKVKRFISILMTALMLVNLMPVGALADGITSIGYKPEVAASTGNYTVYVYARFDGDPLPGVTLNGSQWYTIGYIKDVNLPSPGGISWGQYWYYNNNNYCGSTINSTSASGIIGGLVQEYNTSIVIKSDEWISANFKACPGADTYKPHTSEPTWHLDIIVDINKNPPVHNLVFKVNNSNGKQIGTPKKVTGRWTNPLWANKYYAGNPVPETIIDGGRIYQLKTKREGNPNLDTKIYFDEPIKNVEFYYKDMGPVKRNYTVNYYLNGTEEKVKTSTTGTKELGETVTPDTNVSGYTLVPDQKTSLTIVDGDNVLNLYYYKNVELTANSDTVPYNGQEQEVSGFTGAPKDADFSEIKVGAKGRDVGTYTAAFADGTVDTVDATGKYIVTKAINGTLKITPVTDKVVVTITGHNDTVTYNGSEQSVEGYDVSISAPEGVSYTAADFSYNGTAKAAGTNVGTYPMGLTADQFANTNGNFTNVTFNVTDGWLKINPAETEVTVTITGHTGSHTYDGNEKTVTGYDVSIDNELYTENDFTFTGTAEAKGTDAGTYPMGLTADQFTNNKSKNFSKVTFEVADGWLKIDPVETEVFVKIAGNTKTETYNGKEHNVEGYTVTSISNPLYTANDFTFSGTAEAKGTDAGTYPMGLTADQFTNNKSKNFSKVTFEVADGWLKINPIDKVTVTITGRTLETTYDGKEHDVFGYDATPSNALYRPNEDIQFNGTDYNKIAKGTDAGTYPMGLEVSYFTNISDNFTNVEFIVTDGYVKINPRPVMLTSANLIKVYDGTPLTNGDAPVKEEFGTEKAFPEGEGVTYAFTGGQTNAGSSKNMFTYAWNEGTNKDNYTIYQIEGDLVVTPIDGIKVTITGHKDTQTYDGKPHKVEGYDVKPDNPLFTEKDIEFNGEAEATGTDVRIDPYQMGLKPEQFTNTSNNFTNVEFVVEDGQIVITPRAVTLTSETAGKTYDGTALEKPVVTVGGDGFVEGQVTEIKATGSVTNAGSVANTITFTPNKETFKEGNYAITKTEGTLTIAKRSVLITSPSATKTYDGSALTRPAVTITGDGFVPGELAKAEATGSITKVGSTPNAIRYTTTGAFNAANYSIALSVGTLTVTEKPKPEPRRTFNLTISYVYQNGKRAAASYNRGGLKNGETFDITSPVIAGYTASETVVSGTIYNRDIKVTVIYTADGVNLDDYGVPLGLGNITMNVGDCFE